MPQQNVRLFDMLILGPAMMYMGYRAKGVGAEIKGFVALAGLFTVLYNGYNYFRVQRGQIPL